MDEHSEITYAVRFAGASIAVNGAVVGIIDGFHLNYVDDAPKILRDIARRIDEETKALMDE